MKTSLILFYRTTLSVLLLLISINLSAQNTLSASNWQEDLRFLQTTVHKDYPFLFKKITAEEWDGQVNKLYTEIPNLKEHEIKVGFSRIVSLFQYGHTQVPFSAVTNKLVLPVNLHWFGDGIFIEGVHKDYAATVGAKVLEVEGVPLDTALKMIRPVVPAENEQYFKAYGLRFLTAPTVLHAQKVIPEYKTAITLTLEKDGRRFQQIYESVSSEKIPLVRGFISPNDEWVSSRDQKSTPYYLKHIGEKMYYFEYLEDEKTVYARQSRVRNEEDESLASFYARLFEFIDTHDVERLVYDVRLNGGGNNFLNKPLITGIIETKKINQKGKLFVILGKRTFSACQNMVNELDNYTNAVFLGEPTAENINFYGDTRPVTMPNSKLTAYLSWAWWQNKAPWENADWLAPDMLVKPTFEEYANNEDPVLEAALNFDSTNFIVSPMDYLTELFVKQDFELLETTLKGMVKDERYGGIDFPGQLNRIAAMLGGRGDYQGANYLRELHTRVYPEDAAAWNNLADLKLASKEIEKAKECLQKAIALDGNGPEGEKARKVLDKIEN